MNGFFLVDKPKGCTSYQVVNQIKRKFNLKKCGHNGTLDPNTTGLMVVACDEATKMMKYIVSHDKVYETTILFGYLSDTLDVTGRILEEKEMSFTLDDLKKALDVLKAQNFQTPPLFSAIKVGGKNLYEYARKEEAIEVTKREVTLYQVDILSDLRIIDGHLEIDLRLHCSKGYYVRSFARELGELLGGIAIMKELRRIRSGIYDVDSGLALSELKASDLIEIPKFFNDFEILNVNDYVAHLALNGVVFDERQIKSEKPFYVVHNHAIIAIYEVVGKYKYKPLIIFKEPMGGLK